MEVTSLRKHTIFDIIDSVIKEIDSLFQIILPTQIYLILGIPFMEKIMKQIYREELPCGSYSVYGEYGINGDLVLSDFHYGSDVEEFWGNDEYEYYLIIDKDDVPMFVLESLSKGFNSDERFTITNLKKMCDEKEIKYTTTSYV